MSIIQETVDPVLPRPAHRSQWIPGHPLSAFFLLAFGLSWSLWGVAYLIGGGGMALLVLGAFGPMAAAAIVTKAEGGSTRSWLRGLLKSGVSWPFYLYAIGVPVTLYAAVNAELALLGRNIDLSLLPRRMAPLLLTIAFVALLGGGQEEAGWRGFALPRLQASHTPFRATLILGFLWGLWHIPLYGPLGFVVPLLLAPFYSYVFNRTGSVLSCLLLHGSFTAAQEHLTLIANPTHGITDVTIGFSYLAGVLVLLMLTRGRLGKNPEVGRGPTDHRVKVFTEHPL